MSVWKKPVRLMGRAVARVELVGLCSLSLLGAGCASPGPPRAPSLQLPAVVDKLEATREAGVVELRFAVPGRTSDGLPYRGSSVRARVCRAVEAGPCVPVAALSGVTLPVTTANPAGLGGAGSGGSVAAQAKLTDVLPGSLTVGAARLLTYRVELSNERGRTAGFGDAAFAAAGAAPAEVVGLRAEGSRRGVAVRWQPASATSSAQSGDVVLRRELVGGVAEPPVEKHHRVAGVSGKRSSAAGQTAKPAKTGKQEKPGLVWLSTVPEADPLANPPARATDVPPNSANGVLDDGAAVGGTYRYAAERRETVQIGGHTLELRSALSAPVEVTLLAVYPPPAPRDLVGTAFPQADGAGMAVDLIWTPADDPGTMGYKVFRDGVLLTKELVKTPAFHDVLPAYASGQLRYRVIAVDGKGMESTAAETVVGLK